MMERKVCFILDPSSREKRGEGRFLSKDGFPLTDKQWASVFIDRGMGLCAETAQLALTVIFKLIISGLISIILIVLSIVNLQFQDQFIPISLRPVLRIFLEARSQNGGSP